jgi:Rieske Fe-S protein
MYDKTNSDGRRKFLKKMGLLAGLGISLPTAAAILNSCEDDEGPIAVPKTNVEVNVNDYPALADIGGGVQQSFKDQSGRPLNNGYDVMIIRIEQEKFLTVTTECSHQGCIVALPESPGASCNCPCHGSKFSSTDGSVVSKPDDGTNINGLKIFPNTFDAPKNLLTITI